MNIINYYYQTVKGYLMRFYDAYEYEIDTNLCKTEQRLKDLYFENQDRHLEKPHDIKDCRDIFVKASQTED